MRRPPLRSSLVLLSCLLAGTALAADWPQFRGPNRDGISRETGLLKSWPAGGPKVLWKTLVGEGYSHLVVSKGRLFTLFGEGSSDFAVAYDAATGKPLWRVPLGPSIRTVKGTVRARRPQSTATWCTCSPPWAGSPP